MMTRILATLLLSLLLIGGIIAAFYIHSIESALMPEQMRMELQSISASSMPMAHKTVTAQQTAVTILTATATTMPADATVLARDTFQRANQVLWGTASNGQSWQGDANQAPAFSIVNSMGQIAGNQVQGVQTYNALLGTTHSNVGIVASSIVNQFGNGVNFGVVLRWTDSNNWYKALIDGTNLTIIKHVNGVTTQLGFVRFPSTGGTSYTLHFQAIGATLYASAWPSSQTAPAQWMLVVSDTSLTTGLGGVRVVVLPGTVIQVSSFLETMACSGI